MNRHGAYVSSGRLFFRLRDGSSISCSCISGPDVEQVIKAVTRRRTGPKPSGKLTPWLEYGYSERTYYRRNKLGLLPKRKTK